MQKNRVRATVRVAAKWSPDKPSQTVMFVDDRAVEKVRNRQVVDSALG